MTRVRFVARAAGDARRIDAWWRENRRDARDLFRDELATAVALLGRTPLVGAPYSPKPGVRRLLLRRTNYVVYYTVSDDAASVEVRAVWHAARGQEPSL